MLPALDDVLTFRRRDGSLSPQRISLTDGGIYDDFGPCPLWPDRDAEVSVGVERLDTIVACRAGYGLRTVAPSIFVKARMTGRSTRSSPGTERDDKKAAAAHAANIRAYLERRGASIGSYDLLIAGHARSSGLIVVTGNLREFNRVEGLRSEEWVGQAG